MVSVRGSGLGGAALWTVVLLALTRVDLTASAEPAPPARTGSPQSLTLAVLPYQAAPHIYRVVARQFDAGAAAMRPLEILPAAVKAELRVLAEAPPHPDVLLGVRRDLDPELKQALARALLEPGETEAGRAILGRLGWKRIVRAKDADYDVTREFARKRGLRD